MRVCWRNLTSWRRLDCYRIGPFSTWQRSWVANLSRLRNWRCSIANLLSCVRNIRRSCHSRKRLCQNRFPSKSTTRQRVTSEQNWPTNRSPTCSLTTSSLLLPQKPYSTTMCCWCDNHSTTTSNYRRLRSSRASSENKVSTSYRESVTSWEWHCKTRRA